METDCGGITHGATYMRLVIPELPEDRTRHLVGFISRAGLDEISLEYYFFKPPYIY